MSPVVMAFIALMFTLTFLGLLGGVFVISLIIAKLVRDYL